MNFIPQMLWYYLDITTHDKLCIKHFPFIDPIKKALQQYYRHLPLLASSIVKLENDRNWYWAGGELPPLNPAVTVIM